MLFWLRTLAAVFTGIAAVVNFVRYGKTQNNGHLFLGCAFLATAAIFSFLAFFYGP
jgi:hypothetical protein